MATVRRIAHEFLEQQGLTTIFGNPGSNELSFLAELPESFHYVLGLHEGVVVGMADGYAQATGQPALVNLHATAGSGNALGALTNAAAARTPLVITAGQQVRSAIGLEAMLSNVDAETLMRPLVGWAGEPACATDVPRSLAQATFQARLRQLPSYLSIPYDDWDAESGTDSSAILHRSVQRAAAPNSGQSDRLVNELSNARRPALVLGGDIDTAGLFDDAVTLAQRWNIPTWAAPSLFRLPFPNRHPLFQGVLPAGIAPIAESLEQHDLVLVLGAPVFRYHQHVPGAYLASGTRLIQVTDDADAAARAPVGEALVAEPASVIATLIDAAPDHAEAPWRYTPPAAPATASEALHPEQVFATLRAAMPVDTSYVVESTATNLAWWNQMDLRHGGSYYFPAAGGLGFGMPATLGVALGQPGRSVVGVLGDGSANYGVTALWTAARYGIDVTFVLLRNGSYGALQWFGDLLGVPNVPGIDIPGMDFVKIAEGYGVAAVHASDTDELRAALTTGAAGPRLIQVDTALTAPS